MEPENDDPLVAVKGIAIGFALAIPLWGVILVAAANSVILRVLSYVFYLFVVANAAWLMKAIATRAIKPQPELGAEVAD